MSVLPELFEINPEVRVLQIGPGREASLPALPGHHLQVNKGFAQLIDPMGRMQGLRPGQRIELQAESGWSIWNEHVNQDLEITLAA